MTTPIQRYHRSIGVYSTPTTMLIDPERQVQFKREDMRLISLITQEATSIGTLKGKPWSTAKGLQGYAEANSGKIRVANHGVMSATHFNALGFARNLGIEIRSVTNDDAGDSQAQLLGGHIEVWSTSITSLRGPAKEGSVSVRTT